jgi:raffinose/stachyose/melibiose transport system substrate-binding protein
MIVALAATVGLTMTGCTAAASGSSSSKTVTLSVAGFEGGGTEIADIPEINKQFEKAYPNIKLNYHYVVNQQYDQYMNPRLASGTAADVVMTDVARTIEWQKEGYLSDLSNQSWVPRLLPNIVPFGKLKGKTYTFTQENVPVGLYANLDVLKSAGINTVPQTWPEFVADLKTLKSQGKNGILLPNLTGWTAEQLTMMLAANLVPNNWGPKYDNSASTTWTSAYGPVFDKEKELLTDGLVNGTLMNGIEPFNVGNQEWINGGWAFTVQGAWNLATVAKGAKFNFSLNPFPGGPAGSKPKSFTFVGSGWGVYSKSPHQAAAKEYVAFMAEPKIDREYLAAENSFSTLKDVPSPTMPRATSFVAAFNDSRTTPSPIEFIAFPASETEFWKVGSALFQNPTQSNAVLLGELDQTIPKTKS